MCVSGHFKIFYKFINVSHLKTLKIRTFPDDILLNIVPKIKTKSHVVPF